MIVYLLVLQMWLCNALNLGGVPETPFYKKNFNLVRKDAARVMWMKRAHNMPQSVLHMIRVA